MRVEVLAVGDELLYGDIVNGNAAWLGQRLSEAGAQVLRSVVVGDSVATIASALTEALGRAEAVVVTGGLGPTQDDLTREGLAAAAGVTLVRDDFLEAHLRRRFGALRRDVPEMNFRQADLPQGASALPNERGTAPGLQLECLGGVVYCLPGVPHEMHAMFEGSVLPDLLRRSGEHSVVVHRLLRTSGMWESAVAEAMAPAVEGLQGKDNPVIAFLASGAQTRVKITARAATAAEAEALIAPIEAFGREVLGVGCYGVDDVTLEGVVHTALQSRGETVAVAESLTGGMLAGRLTDTPGASATFRGGVVVYATDLKDELLGTQARSVGAVSAETAAAMAVGVRERLGATYGLSTTGVAGPTEQEGQPVGTVFLGLAGPDGVETREVRFGGDRSLVRSYSCVSALDLLRRHLARLSG